jgi:hypothetical protein
MCAPTRIEEAPSAVANTFALMLKSPGGKVKAVVMGVAPSEFRKSM